MGCRNGKCRAVSAEYPSACGPDGCWDRTGALFSTNHKGDAMSKEIFCYTCEHCGRWY